MTTTPNLPGPERVKGLMAKLSYEEKADHLSYWDKADLLDVLNALPALQAENERLRIALEQATAEMGVLSAAIPYGWKARAEKAEKDVAMFKDFLGLMTKRANEAEAELAAARPVIEAVMKADVTDSFGTEPLDFAEDDGDSILRAALAYRQRKGAGND
jgi:hypothetical protein